MSHPLTNSEIQKYENEPKFNGVFSRNNLPEIKDVAYVINLGGYKSIRMHWIALYVIGENAIYFDSFEVEYIPEGIKEFIENKNILTNIHRIQVYKLIIYKCFCIGFIDSKLNGKSLSDYTNLFSPNK